MTHPGVSLDLTFRLVAQEVEGAGLRDVIAAIGVGGKAGGVVCHGVDSAAVDHAIGVFALRLDVQPEYGVIFLYHDHFNMVVSGKEIFALFVLKHFNCNFVHFIFVYLSIILFFSVSHIFSDFYSFFEFGVDKRQMRAIMNI